MPRFAWIISLLLLAHPLFARQPASQPASLPSTQVTDAAVEKGLALLNDNNNESALQTLQDACALYPRSSKCFDDNHVTLCHAAAVAYMRIAQPVKAIPYMERAMETGNPGRTLLLNYAKLEILTRREYLRAASFLERYLSAHPDDEPALNLLGVAINTAVTDNTSLIRLDRLVASYNRWSAALERGKPNMKRWGIKWIPSQEYSQLQSEKERNQTQIRSLQRQIQDYQKRLDQEKDNMRRRTGASSSDNAKSTQQIAEYNQHITDLNSQIKGLQSSTPALDWNGDFTPLLPERTRSNTPAPTPAPTPAQNDSSNARILIVIDCRNSMLGRLPVAVSAVKTAVAFLPSTATLNAVAMRDGQALWLDPQMLPASDETKRRLSRFLDSISCNGSDDVRDLLAQAAKLNPTEVWLESLGEAPDRAAVLAGVVQTAKAHSFKIISHMASAYLSPDSRNFLSAVTSQTGGVCYTPAGKPADQ